MKDDELLRFPCVSCGRILTAKREMAGRDSVCPACKSAVVVPPPLLLDFGQSPAVHFDSGEKTSLLSLLLFLSSLRSFS